MTLDPSTVNGWILNSGGNNFGILIRALGGTLNIISTISNAAGVANLPQGPILQISYGDSAGAFVD